MKKKLYSNLVLLMCAVFLFAGCTANGNTGETQKEVQETEKKSEVRSSFIEEQVTETQEPQEVLEPETEPAEAPDTQEAPVFAPEPETEPATEAVPETETETKPGDAEAIVASENTFDYVALGNSVTCNDVADGNWWGSWGMAASSEDKDYIHLVARWLGGQVKKSVATTVLDLKKWEVAQNRNAVLADYEGYFNEHTDLVTIQTGENITSFKETLGGDYTNLVKLIKEKAPNAQILMLGETLWPSEDIEAAKRGACAAYGVPFIEMTYFLNGYEAFYRSALGAVVSGADGGQHTITNEVVAAHPNDEGMACIAQLVINHINVH